MRTQKEYFDIGLQGLLRDKNYRDLGKLFAEANEYFQQDWINENCDFQVEKRNDFDDDADASGYDLISADSKMKIQSKLRATFEKKNNLANLLNRSTRKKLFPPKK